MGPEKERLLRDVLDLDEGEAARIVNLTILARARRNRLQGRSQTQFDLTEDDLKRSTEAAMRLADSAPCSATRPATTREKAHALLDEFSDAELDEIAELVEALSEEAPSPDMAQLPEAWRKLPSSAPAPNWVAAVNEVRRRR